MDSSTADVPTLPTEIVELLRDEDDDVRERAIDTIRKVEPASSRALYADAIAKLLDDESENVRCAVCDFIYELEPMARMQYVDAVASKIVDPPRFVRLGWTRATVMSDAHYAMR